MITYVDCDTPLTSIEHYALTETLSQAGVLWAFWSDNVGQTLHAPGPVLCYVDKADSDSIRRHRSSGRTVLAILRSKVSPFDDTQRHLDIGSIMGGVESLRLEGRVVWVPWDLFMVMAGHLNLCHETGLPKDSFGKTVDRMTDDCLSEMEQTDLPYRIVMLLTSALDLLGAPWLCLGRWPSGKRFGLALTHDVDRAGIFHPAYTIASLAGLMKALLLLRADTLVRVLQSRFNEFQLTYRVFDDIVQLERKYGVRSSFFILGGKLFADYGRLVLFSPKMKRTLRALSEHSDVSVHSSFAGSQHGDVLRAEKLFIETITGRPAVSHRSHHLLFTATKSPGIWDDGGLEVDTSIGYSSRDGWRVGSLMPYRFFCPDRGVLDLREIPMAFMDATHWGSMERSNSEKIIKSKRNLDSMLRRLGGQCSVASVLWHQTRFFNEVEFPAQGSVYEWLLDRALGLDGFMGSAMDLLTWSRQRDALVCRWNSDERAVALTWSCDNPLNVRVMGNETTVGCSGNAVQDGSNPIGAPPLFTLEKGNNRKALLRVTSTS